MADQHHNADARTNREKTGDSSWRINKKCNRATAEMVPPADKTRAAATVDP
jgi:hypothetical protein